MPPREETLEDLYREVGLRPAALDPRNTARRKMVTPLPPSMRGLPGYAASNVSRMAEEDIGRGRALGMEPGRGNQVREAAGMLAETTGLPGALRANQAFSEGDTARGLGEAGMGLLNLAGTASMFAPMRNVPRAPVRAAIAEAPTPPPTLSPTWERAADGSVLPVRPQSDRLFSRTAPTSADLRGAAATPPAINAPREWTDLYHGGNQEPGPWRGSMWTTPDRAASSDYAMNFRAGGSPNVQPLRGDISDAVTIRNLDELRAALGPENRRLIRTDREVWENLDDRQIQEALRARGVRVVSVPQDYTPSTMRPHPSYLFLDESRVQPRAQPSISPSLGDLPAPRPRGNAPDPGGVFVNASGRPIRAYHGSPHDFDRFDASRIGTGEGAQAYGHGLYFAENEGVARSYRDALARTPADPARDVMSMISAHRGNVDATRRSLLNGLGQIEEHLAAHPASGYADVLRKQQERYQQALYALDSGAYQNPPPLPEPFGRMYEVNIHADPQDFLDWDAPLANQPSNVWRRAAGVAERYAPDALRTNGIDTGEGLIRSASNKRRVSEALADAGIPGIRYLDQGSRNWQWLGPDTPELAREQGYTVYRGNESRRFPTREEAQAFVDANSTRNYVIFPGMEDIIEILRKYGIGGLGVGAAAGAGAQQNAPGS